jgi:hypothetical protein
MTIMTRYMYDAIHLQGIPTPIPLLHPRTIVAYYLNGDYAVESVAGVATQFPNASLNPIDVLGNRYGYARTVDVESGDVAPEDCEEWITGYIDVSPWYKTGGRPVVYCNRDNEEAVREGTGPYVLGRDYYLWIATGDGTLVTGPGIVACQNMWHAAYDQSTVFSNLWIP